MGVACTTAIPCVRLRLLVPGAASSSLTRSVDLAPMVVQAMVRVRLSKRSPGHANNETRRTVWLTMKRIPAAGTEAWRGLHR